MLNIIEIEDFQALELEVFARLTEAQLLKRKNGIGRIWLL